MTSYIYPKKNSFKGVVSLVTYITMVMLLLSSVYNANACGPLNGIIPIGASQPNNTSGWTSIANALTYINANGLDGHTILELQTDYSAAGEPLPITFPVNACINISQTLTIRPASLVASPFVWSNGTTNSAVVLMDGASYVTIDGRPGGAGTNKYIRIVNTSTTSASSGNAVLLKNDANNNILTYLDVQSANGNAAVSSAVVTAGAIPGAIAIGTTSGTNGNDNNTISFCDVHSTGANLGTCIYAGNNTTAGTAGNNDNNTITDNNIYDFYLSASPSAGINISLGNNSWTITNNHVYQTGTRNYGASTPAVRGFLIVPNNGSLTSASGFIITGNYIGGNAANGSGLYTTTGTANYTFRGMDVSVGLGTATSIQNNTLTNWSISGGFNGNSVYGIDINAGNADVGTITGNVVGSTSTTGAITVTTSVTNGSMIGLRSGSAIGGIINFSNDTISGINMVGTATTIATGFNGITASGGATITVSNNVVGSATLANSINMVSTSTTTITAPAVRGIICNSGVSGVVNSITDNLVANINSNYSAGVLNNTLVGIDVRTGTSTISGNEIRNLTTNSVATGSAGTPAAIGIAYTSVGTSTVISNNIIHSIKLTHPTTAAATKVTGIYFNGPSSGTHTIERNFIHSISITSPTNSAGFITGMDLGVISGVTITVQNNMIRLGHNETGASIVSPCTIRGITKTLPNTNIWFNSIYIGGTGAGTTATNTFCLTRTAAATDDWRNNILVNNRSNATTGGKHYQINLSNTTTLTLNYNVYYGAGTGTVFGFDGTSDVASYSSGWVTGDANSWTFDPKFIDPTGNSTSVDLHISTSLATPVEGLGTNIASVTNDYDDLTPRSGLTPVDIGADAGNFQALSACAIPGTPGTPSLTAVLPSQIDGTFTAGSGADSYLIVRYNGGDPETPPVNGTTYTAGQLMPGGLGTVLTVTTSLSFSATGLIGGTAYDFYVYSLNNICIGTSLYSAASASSATTLACTGLAGAVPIGPGQPNTAAGFTSITNAISFLTNNGLTASAILELQSTYVSSVETFPISIGSIPCAAPTKTLTIRPASGATGLSITSGAAATIEFAGAKYVTIDGRPAGIVGAISVPNSNYLTITNTLATGVVVQMINDASDNIIKYCDLQGQNTTTAALPGSAAGVVFIGNTTGTTGNDNNTIDNCNIHSTLNTNTLTMGVYSFGPPASGTVTPAFNDNNSITNNNIYDIYGGVNLPTAGIELEKGTNAWTITGNSFFQTINRTPVLTASVVNRCIYIVSTNTSGVGNGFTVSGNYIGGSTVQCGGTAMISTSSAATFNNQLTAIEISVAGGSATNVKSNTITNINISQGTSTGDIMRAIAVTNNGNVNVGGNLSSDGNIIGSSSATSAIVLTSSSAAPSHMILVSGGATNATNILVQNNKIGGVRTAGTGTSLSGIFCNSSATITIDNNFIGSTTVANSFEASGNTATAQFLNGIRFPSGSATATITNNTICNLNNNSMSVTSVVGNSTAVSPQTGGIIITGSTTTVIVDSISFNIIRNLSNAAPTGSNLQSAALVGIGTNSTASTAMSISNNIIDSLFSTSATAAVFLEGISYFGSASNNNIINGNFIHSIGVNSVSTTASIRGIELATGAATATNNMIRLGYNANANSLTNPITIYGIINSAASQNFYHNSVYIGGSGVASGANNTFAFWRNSTTAADIRNNIFVNARSGAGAGKHYSFYCNAAASFTAVMSLDYNVYNSSPFAFNGTADVTSYAANWFTGDANSWTFDPKFINPTGSATGTPSPVVDLHIMPPPSITPVEGLGVNIPSVTLDFDGDTRSAFSAVDIGADAGNFQALSACATPGTPGTPSLTAVLPSRIDGTFTAGSGADNYLIVRYNSGDPETLPVNGTTYTAGQPLGSGTVVAVTSSLSFSATGLFGGTTYDFYVYSLNDICIGTSQYSVASTNSATTLACIGLAGIVPIGPGQPNTAAGFTSLTNAMSFLANNGLTSSTTLELQGTYVSTVETFPISIGNIPCAAPTKTLTIRPAGTVAAPLLITSSETTSTIDINGGVYVTIDGRPGGTGTNKYLTIENTSTLLASAGNAILFSNEASNNTVTYCEVRSANANVPTNTAITTSGSIPGAIAIGTTTGNSGNDNNTISFCDIHSLSSGGDLGACIYSGNATTAGLPANNDNNIIDNCNIYDFYLIGSASAGIDISLGNNNWTITNNSIYQTGSRTYNSTQTVRSIWVTPNTGSLTSASGFAISNNFVGGTAAACSGTVSVLTGATAWNYTSMDILVGTGTATSIQGNTIANINMTTANASTTAMTGYNVANGNVNVGTTTGNLFGSTTSTTGSHSITFTTSVTLGGVIPFRSGAGGTINFANNTAAGIDLVGSATTFAPSFSGIAVSGGTTINITDNTIGSATVPNSINLVSTSATSTSANVCRGIFVSGGTATTISGNLIANINSNYSATGSQANSVVGIAVTAGTSSVTGNTIRNLTSASQTTGSGASSAIVGIAQTTASADLTVSGNTIHSLRLTNSSLTAGSQITGIFIGGPTTGTNSVSKNNVHSLSLASTTNTATTITGITVSTGITTYTNNMVRLGYDESGNEIMAGVQLRGFTKGAPNANNFYHNSVYIGGTNVISSALNSFAFQRSIAPSGANDDIRNNIFVNNRSNATTGGKHYVFTAPVTTLLTLNYNDYYFNGTGGLFGLNGATDVASYSAGWVSGDINSLADDPQFLNPTGDAANVNLHINPSVPTPVEQLGVNIATVTDDFDSQTRSALTPVDIGADAGNFTPGCFALNVSVTVTAGPAVCPGGNIQLNVTVGLPGTYTYDWSANPTYLTATNISNPIAQNIQSSQTYSVIVSATSGCSTTQTINAIVNEVPDPSGSYNSGPVCEGFSLTLYGINSDPMQTSTNWEWSGPSFSSTLQNYTFNSATVANSGTYTLTVTNNLGCTASYSTNVLVNPNPVLSIGTQTNVSCNGMSDGQVDMDATSGTSPFLFDLDGNQTVDGIYTGLPAGTYTATVNDDNGCSATSLTVTITEPDVLTVGAGSNTPVCTGTSLNLSATPGGGTSGYSYVWTGPNGPIPSVQNPTIASATASDAGNYSVVVTDAHSCTATSANHLVQVIASPTAAIALVGSPNKCLGQQVTVTVTLTGTGPWTCTIPTASYNGVSDSTFTILSSPASVNITPATGGTHTYTVSQVGNTSCPSGGTASGSATVNVSTVPPPSSGPIPTGAAEACANTVMLITSAVMPGQNIIYSWNTGTHSSLVEFSTSSTGPWSAGPFQTTTSQVYVKFGALGGGLSGYYICLQGVNGCGSSINKCLWIRGVVSGPGPITPANGVVACPNTTQAYSCGTSAGASVYSWTLGGSAAPVTSGQGTNNVQVTFPAGFVSGQLCVTSALSCGGSSTSAPRCIYINNNPANPTVLSGAAAVCPGATGVSYSIPAVPGASGYNWTVPANATIATGANSTSITVNFPTPYNGSPSVCVSATSACGTSAARCKTVVSGIPNQPAGITGPLTNICGSTVQYSVVNPVASSYTWTNPTGTTISGSATGSTILLNVSPAFTNGFLTVVANSALCPPATSASRTSSTFYGRPNNPGAITANPALWCPGQGVNFSVIPIAPLPTYTWTVSNGTIDAGQGSSNIDVTWGASVSGTVTVSASNGCGPSAGMSSQSFSSGCREEGINASSANAFSVYPNPAHDKVTVSIDVNEQSGFNLTLRDMSGRVILSEDHHAEQGLNVYSMDLKSFAKGIYMLEVLSANDKWKTKIIIE